MIRHPRSKYLYSHFHSSLCCGTILRNVRLLRRGIVCMIGDLSTGTNFHAVRSVSCNLKWSVPTLAHSHRSLRFGPRTFQYTASESCPRCACTATMVVGCSCSWIRRLWAVEYPRYRRYNGCFGFQTFWRWNPKARKAMDVSLLLDRCGWEGVTTKGTPVSTSNRRGCCIVDIRCCVARMELEARSEVIETRPRRTKDVTIPMAIVATMPAWAGSRVLAQDIARVRKIQPRPITPAPKLTLPRLDFHFVRAGR